MASTYSSSLKIELVGTGEQAGTWGSTTNTNLGTAVEEAITGAATATFSADADLTLTLTDSNASQAARNLYLNVVSGVSLSTTRNLIVPTIEKQYLVKNATTGGQSITVKTSAGSGVTVPNGATAHVFTDGANVVAAVNHLPTLTLGSPLAGTSVSNTPAGNIAATTVQAAINELDGDKYDKTGGDIGGNVNITGTGRRITADFSNATVASRTFFQTNTVNDGTRVSVMPNGTGTFAQLALHSASDPANCSLFQLTQTGTACDFNSTLIGTGSYVPMTFTTGGSERVRFDTSGNVGVGTASPGYKLHVKNTAATSTTVGANVIARLEANGYGADVTLQLSDGVEFASFISQTGANLSLSPGGGSVLVINAAGLGYGVGSGGTVTQATSKATAVTLNKPSGQITMNAAALLTGVEVSFTLSNTTIGPNDLVVASLDNATLTSASYKVSTHAGNGNAVILLRQDSGATLSDGVKVRFAVIKGATS